MKLAVLLLSLSISDFIQAQGSFEGFIKYSTHISTTTRAQAGTQQNIEDNYGDSLQVFHFSNGDFLRKHLNSTEKGNKYQYYNSKTGYLYFLRSTELLKDSLEVKNNSVSLSKMVKTKKETILGEKCNCREYHGVSVYNQNVVITYCYSKKTPKINPKFYSDHNDYFLNKYFKKSKRPFLKFSVETDVFNISYLATEIKEEKTSPKLMTFLNNRFH